MPAPCPLSLAREGTPAGAAMRKLSKNASALLGIWPQAITALRMRDGRLEQTIQRIERALARIGAAADAAASGSKPTHDLADRHEAMRSKVRAELDRLDRVIGELEQ